MPHVSYLCVPSLFCPCPVFTSCTGMFPILKAFKTFATESSESPAAASGCCSTAPGDGGVVGGATATSPCALAYTDGCVHVVSRGQAVCWRCCGC